MNRDDVHKTAHLAKILIDDNQADQIAKDCSNIMQLIEKMQSVDTSDVAPMAHSFDAEQPLRDDVVTEKDQREALQQNAPNAQQGLFLVPTVIE